MEEYYITEDLYFKNKCFYKYDNNKDKEIIINKKNWYKYLKEYGWEKIEEEWKNKLENNYVCLLECGSDGDCLFHVLSEALNFELIFNYKIPKNDICSLRELCANEINEGNFDIILESYRAENEFGEFFGEWDPNNINSIDELKLEIIKLGNNFWGDHILMQLLSTKLEINFVILSDNLNINIINNELKYQKTIFIYYFDNLHFQLIGYFNGRYIETVFDNNNLPICFSRLIC